MMFALVQASLDRIERTTLEDALLGAPGLAPLDAAHLTRHAFGILAERLSLKAAQHVHDRLTANGVDVRLVDQAELPEPPPTRRVQSIKPEADGLFVEEAASLAHLLPAAEVLVVSLGVVKHADNEPIFEERVRYWHTGSQTLPIPYFYQLRVGTAHPDRILIEVLTATTSYELKRPLEAGDPTPLVEQLVAAVPRAERSAGCAAALEHQGVLAVYPSLHAYRNELRWRLYQAKSNRPRLKA
jgi:hypothetical protein